MISINELTKYYQHQCVLAGITEDIPDSGITSLVGPNGAGKSTLLAVIARLLPADKGTVLVDGLNAHNTQGHVLAKKLSVLRQENHFVSRLTVYDLVSFGRYPYSQGRLSSSDQEHIFRALAFFDLTSLRQRYLDELSGGQRQRAWLAMVMCQDTKYILLDEPLNNLDMKHSVLIMQLLKRAADEFKKSVILVIHDINFAAAYSDWILALCNGQLIFRGGPQEFMVKEIIEKIFDIDVSIEKCKGRPVAVYY
jgi:iron complex transport system ATP-binding protein